MKKIIEIICVVVVIAVGVANYVVNVNRNKELYELRKTVRELQEQTVEYKDQLGQELYDLKRYVSQINAKQDEINERIDTETRKIWKSMFEHLEEIEQQINEVEQAKQYTPPTPTPTPTASYESEYDHPFKSQGVIDDYNGFSYTYYSQRVLPGGGLDIPGRNVNEEGFVCDGDGNICVASDDLPKGTEVDTPYGKGVVYDTGSGAGNLDLYTDW